ncbi:MAG: serine/threonine-protein kinase [Pseudonocardiaceae bacterium]
MTGEGELIAGRYRLISRLGSGAMGMVWQAQDERLRRTVAIKQLLLPSRLSDIETDEANRRAMREGRITARLQHPQAIAVYDVVEHEGQPCLIMEYLPSRSLATALSVEGVLPSDHVARIGSQIASALAAAHREGIVHRDIKPGNVLIADDGTVKITDFGVSHAVGDVTVTATGILAGTPAYLAPEVAQGNSAGFPSDVFSLGSTLYTALEGAPPFGLDNNAIALLHRVASGEITPPRQSGPLIPLLLRLLHRDPEQRPTMQQAHDGLATLAAGLDGSQDGPSAPTLSLSRGGPIIEPVATTQQTFIQSAPPEMTTTPVVPIEVDHTAIEVDHTAGQPLTEDDRDRSAGRRRLLAGAMAVLVLAAGVLAIVFISNGMLTDGDATGGNITARPTSTSDGPAQDLQPRPTQAEQGNTAQGGQTLPSQPEPSGTTQIPLPTISAAPENPQNTPEQLQQSITDYYALMPENLPAAWERLTADYQQNHARGFAGYQDFWNQVQRVTVFDVSVQQGDVVDATIEYLFKDGRAIEEQTRYGLLAEDGLWKINSSTVRSSQTKQDS